MKIINYYFECKTEKENMHIKIRAENEEKAKEKLLNGYKIIEIVGIRCDKPIVNYAFERNQYPYIKQFRDGSYIRVFT